MGAMGCSGLALRRPRVSSQWVILAVALHCPDQCYLAVHLYFFFPFLYISKFIYFNRKLSV